MHTLYTHGRVEGMARHDLYFSSDQEALLERLGIENLSAYVRSKMEEDARRGSTLVVRKEELDRLRQDLAAKQAAFEAKALAAEEQLALFDAAAAQVRRILAADPRASVQTTILRWVRANPAGRQIREVLPASLSDAEVVDVLARWPDSRADVEVLLEVRR
jgi:hypothetical protein